MPLLNRFDRNAQNLQTVVAQRLIQFVAPGHELVVALAAGIVYLILHNAAAALLFGQLAGRFCLFNQICGVGRVGIAAGQPHAEVNAELAIAGIDAGLFDAALEHFGAGFGLLHVGVLEQNGKLITAQAGTECIRCVFLQQRSDALQTLVAAFYTVVFVDQFELINIRHQQRAGAGIAQTRIHALLQQPQEVLPVDKTGERVNIGLFGKIAVNLLHQFIHTPVNRGFFLFIETFHPAFIERIGQFGQGKINHLHATVIDAGEA